MERVGGSRRCGGHPRVYANSRYFIGKTAQAPELQPLRGRFAIGDGQLKNHIRCVALSRDNRRCLFTAHEKNYAVRFQLACWNAPFRSVFVGQTSA